MTCNGKTGQIVIHRDGNYAPCGFLLCRVLDDNGTYEPYSDNSTETILIDYDWDFPDLASNWGFVACECGETDGTVNCKHRKTGDMISAAFDWLEDHQGEAVNDPGYFGPD
jgi:hypothetical protein